MLVSKDVGLHRLLRKCIAACVDDVPLAPSASCSVEENAGAAGRFLAYWTHQSMLFTILYFLAASITGAIALRASASSKRLPMFVAGLSRTRAMMWWTLLRLTRILYHIAITWECSIVVMFWAVLAEPSKYASVVWWVQVAQHLLGAIWMLIDTLVGAQRPQDRVFLAALGSVLVYLVCNIIVTKATRPVYSVVTWDNGFSGVLVFAAFVLLTLWHYVFALLAWQRDRLVQRRFDTDRRANLQRVLENRGYVDIASVETAIAAGKAQMDVSLAWCPHIFLDEWAAFPCSQACRTGSYAQCPGCEAAGCRDAVRPGPQTGNGIELPAKIGHDKLSSDLAPGSDTGPQTPRPTVVV